MNNDLSIHLLGHVHTDLSENMFDLFIFLLLFCLTTKTYLPPQPLVYMPIDLPVHYPTCSFWLFRSDKPFVHTCPLTCCSKYSQIYPFINQPVPLVCFLTGFTCTRVCTCTLICWSAYRQTHPKMNVPVNFDASGYNHDWRPNCRFNCLHVHRCTRSNVENSHFGKSFIIIIFIYSF